MTKDNLYCGESGERLAQELLRQQGYRIVKCNYKTRLGEIDIIATDADTVCFVEVKTRRSDAFGNPSDSVHPLKQRQMAKVALGFLQERKLLHKRARFDVVSVKYAQDIPHLHLTKDAFELDARYTY